MRTLREIVLSGDDEHVIKPEFRAYTDTSLQVIVQAVLSNTAVVYPIGEVTEKSVVKLERILVPEENVQWVPRNPNELRELRSRQLGQKLGAGFRGQPQKEGK